MDERVAPLRVLLAVRSLYVIAVVPGWFGWLNCQPTLAWALAPMLPVLAFFWYNRIRTSTRLDGEDAADIGGHRHIGDDVAIALDFRGNTGDPRVVIDARRSQLVPISQTSFVGHNFLLNTCSRYRSAE